MLWQNKRIEERKKHMKTPEELTTLKNEVEALNKKLAELTEEELEQVAGGVLHDHLSLNCYPWGREDGATVSE